MTNDVAVQENGGAVATPSANPFKRAAGQMNVPTGMPFLSYSGKTGKYTVGQDKKEVPYGTRYAVNMNEFKRGWICWLGGSVEEELMVRVLDGDPLSESELTDHSEEGDGAYDDQEGWSYQISVPFRDVETGEEALFKVSSKSGVNQLSALLNSYADAYEMHTDEVMVIEIDSEEFEVEKENAKGRKVKFRASKPILDVVEWMEEDELAKLLGMDSDAEDMDEDALRDDDDDDDNDRDADADADEQEEAPRKQRGTGKISDKKRGRR